MTVCNFFLQGRCRYGEKCWNEHPRGGKGGEYGGNQQPSRGGGGGFGNRVWVNPSQRSGGNYIQPSTFSRDGADWSRRDVKSSDFSFSTQNRFSSLNSQNNNDKDGQTSVNDNIKHVDTIQKDMEIWQSSGQWLFSCYSVLIGQISGFVELSPEELRLEYYTSRASGDLQAYVNSVQQLANQWRSRVQELKTMTNSTQMSVISELNNSSPQTSSHGFESSGSGFSSSSGFGSASGFGTGGFGSSSQSSSSFSFASSRTGFGSSDTQQHASGFSSTASAQPPSGFASAPPSAASFSFAAPAAENKPSAGAFGSSAGFSFKSSSSSGAFGTGFGSSAPSAGGGGVAQSSSISGSSGNAGDKLFTAHSDLTAEELKEFTAKRFTLGQIPLKAPPADLLMV